MGRIDFVDGVTADNRSSVDAVWSVVDVDELCGFIDFQAPAMNPNLTEWFAILVTVRVIADPDLLCRVRARYIVDSNCCVTGAILSSRNREALNDPLAVVSVPAVGDAVSTRKFRGYAGIWKLECHCAAALKIV